MKNYLKLFFLITLLIGCDNKRSTQRELVTEYYEAFNSSDYTRLADVIADSITIIEGEYETFYSLRNFHTQFKWDSIFQPSYKIIKLENYENQIIASISSSSLRYKYLRNDPLVCRYKISFDSDKIIRIEVLECPDADWNVWRTERDSLVRWAGNHHPELNGFIHDLTMNGAMNYLKAIELYENRNEAP